MFRSDIARTISLTAIANAVAAAFAVYSPTSDAQAWSAADQTLRSHYQEASLSALMSGDLNRYQSLQQSLPDALSSSCRRVLDQLEPMRVACSAQEKNAVLQHYQAIMQAAWSGDVMGIFAYMENLEATVSRECWLASNRHTDSRVQAACTGPELDHVATFTGPVLRATSRMLSTGDIGPVLQLSEQMSAPLSQDCMGALQRLQIERQQGGQSQTRGYGPTNVLDHGGGTYSVP